MTSDMKIGKEVGVFVGVVFLLLGVLFGMQIFSFIFGNVGTTSSSLDVKANSVINETDGFINTTGYTLAGASTLGFSGPTIVTIINTTGLIIQSGNWTFDTVTGILTNATSETWESVNITYNYGSDSNAKIIADSVTNNSLVSIQTYSNQADTQFNTSAIAITILILVALFAIFWRIFMANTGLTGGKSKNFS